METWSKRAWKIIGISFVVFNIFLTGAITFAVNAFSTREEALQGAASVTYVDGKCKDTREYLDSQDRKLLDYVNTQDDQAVERMNRIQVDLSKKADKDDFDKVYEKCEENNKLSIKLLERQSELFNAINKLNDK